MRLSNRTITIAAWLILLFVAAISVLQSIATPFWYDEICTVIVCRLPSAAIWKALNAAIDTNPPFYYYLARFARDLIADDHLGYRLPSIAGLLGSVACLYACLYRRVDRLSALCAAVFVLQTPLVTYVYQARPYTLMVGCIACAVLAWQRLAESKYYSVLLAVALAAAVGVHYYAVLALPAFVLAELAVWIAERQFRLPAWLAFGVPVIPLLLTRNLLLSVRQYYGQNFWSIPHFQMIFTSHDWLFGVNSQGLALAFLLTSGCLWCLKTQTTWTPTEAGSPLGSAHGSVRGSLQGSLQFGECVLALGLLWLPIFALVVARLGHGGMTPRYMLPAVLGGAMLVGYLLSRAPAAIRPATLGVLLLAYTYSQISYFKNVLHVELRPGPLLRGSLMRPRLEAVKELESLDSDTGIQGLPIVISNGIRYLPTAFYTPPDRQADLYALVDPRSALAYASSDSVDLALVALRAYSSLQVVEFSNFRLKHSSFLLASADGLFDWWPARLLHDGYSLQLIALNGSGRIYRVTAPGAQAPILPLPIR